MNLHVYTATAIWYDFYLQLNCCILCVCASSESEPPTLPPPPLVLAHICAIIVCIIPLDCMYQLLFSGCSLPTGEFIAPFTRVTLIQIRIRIKCIHTYSY